MRWGDIHMVDERGRPLLYQHKTCGKFFEPVMICSECGEPLHAKEVHTHPGPGAPVADPKSVAARATRRKVSSDAA